MPEELTVAPTTESLVDLLDRLVYHGAAINGDVIISLAGIDLIQLNLRVLLAAMET